MSRFFSPSHEKLVPYIPGEQPRDSVYIKLNTNESPFPPSPEVEEAVRMSISDLRLYPDPDASELNSAIAERMGVLSDSVITVNGSDEVLNFAFNAFCNDSTPAIFADITYGFYKVFSQINSVPYREIPLENDFTIDIDAFTEAKGTLFIANPNAPTGIALGLDVIEHIIGANSDRLVVVDEAYVDFGAESAVPLVNKYDNLLVVQTFSKSRSLAGARLGFGIAHRDIIHDLNSIRYSTNPYNVNRMTMAAGIASINNDKYTEKNCAEIIRNREFTVNSLRSLGFFVTDSKANFVFAKHNTLSGETIYNKLKSKSVLVRHFNGDRISDFNRITVGSREQMVILIDKIKEILEEENA